MQDELIVLESMAACEKFIDKAKAAKVKVASKLKKRKDLEIEEYDISEEEFKKAIAKGIKPKV